MLDRKTVERALASASWAEVAAAVSRAASEAAEEGERWRLDSIAVAARAIDQGAKGRDAAAQIREMARLCEGGVRISTELLAWTEDVPWADFAMDRHPLPGGVEAVELRSDAPTGHEVLDEIGEFARALRVEPSLRRNIQPEPADGFFARCASHPAYSSDAQKAALRAVVAMPPGGAVVASLPTGWGKSALFQVSTRHWREMDPTACTVVIVPTVALAQDHERTLSKMPGLDGSRALVGGLKKPERERLVEAFLAGDVPILLMSPEMALQIERVLLDGARRAAKGLPGARLVSLAVDEAHIVSTWGRHFRPDFQRMAGLVRQLRVENPGLRTIILSATLEDTLRTQLRDDFAPEGPAETVFVAEPRTEFEFVSHRVDPVLRARWAVAAVDVLPRPAIVYTTTVEDAENLFDELQNRGYQRIELFTGELDDPRDRERIIVNWAEGNVDLVVATSAFGMGVDKRNVRAVLHACLPEGPDRLYQELGRAARDGHQGLSLVLWTDDDVALAVRMATHGWMSLEMAEKRWWAIVRHAEETGGFSTASNGRQLLRIAMDARHDDLPLVTGRKNRLWNMTISNLVQRAGAIQVVGEEQTPEGERWLAHVLDSRVVEDGEQGRARVRSILGATTVEEVQAARAKADALVSLLSDELACRFSELYELVEPGALAWPCGRCAACRRTDELPRAVPDPHHFATPWPDVRWTSAIRGLPGGSWVVDVGDEEFGPSLTATVRALAQNGVEQFLAEEPLVGAVAAAVREHANELRYGFVAALGGSLQPLRAPTAVLVRGASGGASRAYAQCTRLRRLFAEWPEVPLLFLVPPGVSDGGALLAQHLSDRAPLRMPRGPHGWSET